MAWRALQTHRAWLEVIECKTRVRLFSVSRKTLMSTCRACWNCRGLDVLCKNAGIVAVKGMRPQLMAVTHRCR